MDTGDIHPLDAFISGVLLCGIGSAFIAVAWQVAGESENEIIQLARESGNMLAMFLVGLLLVAIGSALTVASLT